MSAAAVLSTDALCKRFGRRLAVDAVSLEIGAGQAFGFLGPNGAGKTTLIRMVVGLIRPTAGTVRVFGRRLDDDRAASLARVGAIVEEPRRSAPCCCSSPARRSSTPATLFTISLPAG